MQKFVNVSLVGYQKPQSKSNWKIIGKLLIFKTNKVLSKKIFSHKHWKKIKYLLKTKKKLSDAEFSMEKMY